MTTSSKLITAVFHADAKCGNMKYDFFHSKDTAIKATFRETYTVRVLKNMRRKIKSSHLMQIMTDFGSN